MVCRYCSRPVVRWSSQQPYREDALHLDHVVPWATGGQHGVDNLVVSCAGCNLARPKPPAQAVVQQAKIKVEYRDGTYWWPDGFKPPNMAADRNPHLRSVIHMGKLFDIPVIQLIRMAASGQIPATRGSIRVLLPLTLIHLNHAEEKLARKERRDRAEADHKAELAERRRVRATAPDRRPLDPDRVNYWRQVKAEARAARTST